MNILLVQLICGAAGGNLLGAAFANLNLGVVRNTLAGMIGGVLSGQLLLSMMGTRGLEGASDMQIFLTSLVGGVVGGIVLTAIAGWVQGMFKRRP